LSGIDTNTIGDRKASAPKIDSRHPWRGVYIDNAEFPIKFARDVPASDSSPEYIVVWPDVPSSLVVVRGLGEQPMMLLTTQPLRNIRKLLWWVVSAYLTRWRIKEAIRSIKQSYHLEDIRVLTYERPRNMVVLVNAVAFFTAVVLGTQIKLDILATYLLRAAKRLFGIPDFRLYALADGIREVCARSPRPPSHQTKDLPQLTLGFP
jgi:hypothetical protein